MSVAADVGVGDMIGDFVGTIVVLRVGVTLEAVDGTPQALTSKSISPTQNVLVSRCMSSPCQSIFATVVTSSIEKSTTF